MKQSTGYIRMTIYTFLAMPFVYGLLVAWMLIAEAVAR